MLAHASTEVLPPFQEKAVQDSRLPKNIWNVFSVLQYAKQDISAHISEAHSGKALTVPNFATLLIVS
jgi:hypothetical protein